MLLLVLFAPLAICSSGDRDDKFIICTTKCLRKASKPKWYQWEKQRNCQYICMMEITEMRMKSKMDILQYNGKWPFTRMFGLQEPASVGFSVMNCLANIQAWFRFRNSSKSTYKFYRIVRLYTALCIIAWFCAAIFHAKDTWLTEKLDYFSAATVMCFSIFMCVARFAGRENHPITRWFGFGILLFLLHHIYSMAIIRFDYSYNLKVMASVVATNMALWSAWCYQNRRHRKHVRKCLLATVGIAVFCLLELFDFPPFWLVFDAHSLWHLSTVPVTYLFQQFLLDDALYDSSSKFC